MINPNDPEPGMPAQNPTPADIARYNAWAARNGQPAFGVQHAPAPPAAEAPVNASATAVRTAVQNGGRARWNPITRRWELPLHGNVVFLTGPNGQKTIAGNVYYRIARRLGIPDFQLLSLIHI